MRNDDILRSEILRSELPTRLASTSETTKREILRSELPTRLASTSTFSIEFEAHSSRGLNINITVLAALIEVEY
jgi:hypothetical protein